MSKVNVTYKKSQLEDFTVKELKTLDLYVKAEITVTKKSEIVKAMMKFQATEVKKIKDEEAAITTEKPEATVEVPVEEPVTEEVVEEVVEEVEAESTEEVVEESEEEVEKPVFHRPFRRKNVMTGR